MINHCKLITENIFKTEKCYLSDMVGNTYPIVNGIPKFLKTN